MPINPYGGSYTPVVGGAVYSPYVNVLGTGSYQQAQQPQNNMVVMALVNSEDEARNYPLNPGNSIFLMDSNNQVFYTKSVDFSGIAAFKKYQFHEVLDTLETPVPVDYVTREEFESLKAELAKRNKPYKKERNYESAS